MVRILCFHCWGPRFELRGMAKKKKKRKKEARSNVVIVCLHIWVPKISEFGMIGTASVSFGTMVGIYWVLNGCSLNKKLNELESGEMPPIRKEA